MSRKSSKQPEPAVTHSEAYEAFTLFLTRLKLSTGLKQDKEIAALLGLSLKAFSSRKLRNAIPEKELRFLAELWPSLNLNIEYILNHQQKHEANTMFKTDTIFPDHPDFQPILSSLFYANANTPTDLDVLDLDTITSIYVGMTMIVAYQGANAVLFARQR